MRMLITALEQSFFTDTISCDTNKIVVPAALSANIYMNGAVLGFSRKEMDLKKEEILEFADIGDFVLLHHLLQSRS